MYASFILSKIKLGWLICITVEIIKIFREAKESNEITPEKRGEGKKWRVHSSLEIPFFNSRAGNSPLEGKDRSYYRGMARVRWIVDEARTKEIRNRWNFSVRSTVRSIKK